MSFSIPRDRPPRREGGREGSPLGRRKEEKEEEEEEEGAPGHALNSPVQRRAVARSTQSRKHGTQVKSTNSIEKEERLRGSATGKLNTRKNGARKSARCALSGPVTAGEETLPPSPLLPPPQAGNIPRPRRLQRGKGRHVASVLRVRWVDRVERRSGRRRRRQRRTERYRHSPNPLRLRPRVESVSLPFRGTEIRNLANNGEGRPMTSTSSPSLRCAMFQVSDMGFELLPEKKSSPFLSVVLAQKNI